MRVSFRVYADCTQGHRHDVATRRHVCLACSCARLFSQQLPGSKGGGGRGENRNEDHNNKWPPCKSGRMFGSPEKSPLNDAVSAGFFLRTFIKEILRVREASTTKGKKGRTQFFNLLP